MRRKPIPPYKRWDKATKASWEKLKERLHFTEDPMPPVSEKTGFFSSPARLVAVCASIALFIGVGIGVGIGFSNPPVQQMQSSSSAEVPPDENRYCAQSEYTIEETEMTLKEYSLQQEGKILYFDWYENLDSLSNYSCTLNQTSEIIMYREEFSHSDTGYFIFLSVTDNYTEIENLEKYKTSCIDQTLIKEVETKYFFGKTLGYAMWEFDGYKYYMEVQNIMSQDELFALVEELLRE